MTNTTYHSNKTWSIMYWLFVSLYAFLIVYKSSMPLMSGDDIAFYGSLVQGNNVWHGLETSIGRFFPLAGWNLNLIALISTSPYAFMLGNAIVFCIVAFCFYRLSLLAGVNKFAIFVFFVAFSLSVGYTKIITQIVFPENTQILFLCIFLLCAYRFYNSMDSTKHIYIYIYIY